MYGAEPRGLLPPFLLLLIYERPGHGYDLINRLARLGVTDLEPGHVYRVLRSLERRSLLLSVWVASGSGPARRRYELTTRGLTDLESRMARLAEFQGVLGAGLYRWAEACATRDQTYGLTSPLDRTAAPVQPTAWSDR